MTKKVFLLPLALVLIVSLVACTAPAPEPAPAPTTTVTAPAATVTAPATTVTAPAPAPEKPKITFYDGGWGSLWLSNAVAQFIIEEGYGYPTEAVVMVTEVMQVTHSTGDVLVNMELWTQNFGEWWGEPYATALKEVAKLVVTWLILLYMYRKRTFLKI